MKSADVRLDAVLIGGREERAFVIVEDDPSWPQRFDAVAQTNPRRCWREGGVRRAHGLHSGSRFGGYVHVFHPGNDAVPRYRDVRDWLRIDETDRALYDDTKKLLARQRWSDMNDYADAKTDVISQILAHARVWRDNHFASNEV